MSWISSLAFGLVHLDVAQGAGAVVLGLYLGLATELAASVRVAMLCHAANNLLGVAAPELADLRAPSLAATGLAALALLALSGVSLWVPYRRLRGA